MSRLEYMLSNETCIVSEDVSFQGEVLEVPLNYALLMKVWNTPRPDRNSWDHSGPAKVGLTVEVDEVTRQYILPVQMEALIAGQHVLREARWLTDVPWLMSSRWLAQPVPFAVGPG